jgi:hypothetical protein
MLVGWYVVNKHQQHQPTITIVLVFIVVVTVAAVSPILFVGIVAVVANVLLLQWRLSVRRCERRRQWPVIVVIVIAAVVSPTPHHLHCQCCRLRLLVVLVDLLVVDVLVVVALRTSSSAASSAASCSRPRLWSSVGSAGPPWSLAGGMEGEEEEVMLDRMQQQTSSLVGCPCYFYGSLRFSSFLVILRNEIFVCCCFLRSDDVRPSA